MSRYPVSRVVTDKAIMEAARIGASEGWCRELLADCGYALSQRVWDRYWRRVCLLVDRPGPWDVA